MEYAILVLVFAVVLAGFAGVLLLVGRVTTEPEGEDGAPLGDTSEHSDAFDEEPKAA